MVVFGAGPGSPAGVLDGDAGAGEAGAGDGAGDGSGSAPATPTDTPQPASSSPAVTTLAALGALLKPIAPKFTGVSSPFHISAKSDQAGEQQLGQSSHLAGISECVLIDREVVARNLGVHRTFEEEAQHRVVGVIRLVEGEHGGAVGLLLELVITLGTRPE